MIGLVINALRNERARRQEDAHLASVLKIEGPSGSKVPVDWMLKNLDTGVAAVPQFPLEDGVAVDSGSEVASTPRFGFQDALVHWTGGKGKVLTFSARFYAATEIHGDNVEAMVRWYTSLAEKNDALGRPPICLFTYGKHIKETVVVETANPKVVGILRSGKPRDVVIDFSLRKYIPFSQVPVGAAAPAKESYYLAASDIERSYEMLAKRFYGDPLLGDRLMKRNPEYPFAPPLGGIVKIPSRKVVAAEPVTPSSFILSRSDGDARAAYQNVLDYRGLRQVVTVR